MSHLSPPYQYSIRVSARARHVRLAVKPFRGLEVVIPKQFPRNQIPRILHQHQAWITKQLQQHPHCTDEITLPNQVLLRLLDQTFSIQSLLSASPRLLEQEQCLLLEYQSVEQAIQLLRSWLRTKAHSVLPEMLGETAREYGFSYNKISIRSQKSRWGSYSSKGTVSLNDQLMFMPGDTVRYLLIHELCHSRFMNHSAAFWRLVGQCCPQYKEHEAILSQGINYVPEWFRQSLYFD